MKPKQRITRSVIKKRAHVDVGFFLPKKGKSKTTSQGAVIALVGPHYSGKSTLAKKLASQQKYSTIEENWPDDPFVSFRKKGDYLKSQLWFLTETMKTALQAEELKNSGKTVILDTFFHTTRAFCRSKLNKSDFKVFNIIFEAATRNLPLPDLVIYLHGPVSKLLEHANMRAKKKLGPSSDATVDVNWLNKTIKANEVEFGNWKKTPMIKIDISSTDCLNNATQCRALLKEIEKYVE